MSEYYDLYVNSFNQTINNTYSHTTFKRLKINHFVTRFFLSITRKKTLFVDSQLNRTK